MSERLPTTVEALRALVLAQRQVYGDGFTRLAALCTRMNQPDLADAATATRTLLGLGETTVVIAPSLPAPVPEQPAPELVVHPDDVLCDRTMEALKACPKTLFQLRHELQVEDHHQMKRVLKRLRQSGEVVLEGLKNTTRYWRADQRHQS
jgi:hypothetical protein